MDPKFTLEVSKFNAAMRDMSSRLKNTTTMQAIIDFEVARIIERALRGTKAATVGGIRRSAESKEWTHLDGKVYKLSNRFPNSLWRQIAAKRRESLQRKLAARGLSKQAWLALAQKIGYEIVAPGFVQQASTPNHTNAENVAATREGGGSGKYTLKIANNSPLIRWSDARAAFYGAVVGRRKFFEQNLKRGVFDEMAKIAGKYPGLIVKAS